MKYRSILPIIEILIAVIMMTACDLFEKRLTFLDNPQCRPPCWRGIIPGVTTAQTALNILRSEKDIQSSSIKRTRAEQYRYPDIIYWDFVDGGGGDITLNNDTVADLEFSEISYSLKKMIEVYGEPEKVYSSMRLGDAVDYYIRFLYPGQGMVLEEIKGGDFNGTTISVTENDRITSIIYTSPGSFTGLNQWLIHDTLNVEYRYQPWKGYGKIKIVYP